MSFEEYNKKKRRKPVRRDTAIKINKHINFSREKRKSNARKTETPVTCVDCGKEFTLPFKPRKPEVYCEKCFKNRR